LPFPRKGSVLIVTLWILAILSLLGIQYSLTARLDTCIVREGEGGWRDYFHALEVLECAKAMLLYSQGREEGDRPLLFPDGVARRLEFPWGKAEVAVEDEEGKVNLNTAPRGEIYSVLVQVGVDEYQADIIADSILDWRDPDRLVRVNGAEEGFYEGLPHPYRPADGPFKVLTEMLLVRGVTYSLFWYSPGLWRYFTIYSSGRYDPRLSPQYFQGDEGEDAPRPSVVKGHVYRFVVTILRRDGKGRRALVWWGRCTGKNFVEVDRLVW